MLSLRTSKRIQPEKISKSLLQELVTKYNETKRHQNFFDFLRTNKPLKILIKINDNIQKELDLKRLDKDDSANSRESIKQLQTIIEKITKKEPLNKEEETFIQDIPEKYHGGKSRKSRRTRHRRKTRSYK